jgi:hypothetical protein
MVYSSDSSGHNKVAIIHGMAPAFNGNILYLFAYFNILLELREPARDCGGILAQIEFTLRHFSNTPVKKVL